MRDFNRSGSNSRFSGRDPGKRNFGFRGNDRPMMYQAICAECGKSCEVPFKPSGNKEVFCSNCFEKRGGNEAGSGRNEERNFNRFDRRDQRDRVEFTATCDECGKSCKLPFKPSGDKPVYCSDCFNMRGERSGLNKGSDTGKEIREIKDQIISLNVKLEKILKALDVKPEKISKPKTVKVTKTEFTEAVSEAAPVIKTKKAVKKTAEKKVTRKAK